MTTPLSLAEQRQQLALALQPQQMAAYLAELFAPPHRRVQRPPFCHILDVKYEPAAHCTILYQLEQQLLIGALEWRGHAQALPATARLLPPLAMQVYPFADDPALPGLARLLEARALPTMLNAALPLCVTGAQQVVRCRVTPLRYRPGKRCTLRFDLWLRDQASRALVSLTCFGKLYHSAIKAAAVYDEMQQLAGAVAGQHGVLAVAQPLAFLPELPLVLQLPKAGTPLELLLSHPERLPASGAVRIDQGVSRAAAALAELHQLAVCSKRLRPVTGDVQKLTQRTRPVSLIDPELGAAMAQLAQGLVTSLAQVEQWGTETTLVHGDCKPSQFLLDQEQAVLLDFDHCGLADPASDVGMFLATLRQLNVFQSCKTHQPAGWLRELEDAFLARYQQERPGNGTMAARAGWYQALALLRKAQRAFARSPHSPIPAALVAEGQRCLAQVLA